MLTDRPARWVVGLWYQTESERSTAGVVSPRRIQTVTQQNPLSASTTPTRLLVATSATARRRQLRRLGRWGRVRSDMRLHLDEFEDQLGYPGRLLDDQAVGGIRDGDQRYVRAVLQSAALLVGQPDLVVVTEDDV